MIPLTGAGSLYVKLGHFLGSALDVFALEGGPATARVLAPAAFDIGAVLPSPQAPTLTPSGVGGTLATGTYAYIITALDFHGETLGSAEVTCSVVSGGSIGSVGITWPAVTGALSYNVYGRTAGAELKLVNTTSTSYTDTGSASPSGALPSSHITNLLADYNASGTIEESIQNTLVSLRDQFRAAQTGTMSAISAAMQSTIIDMVNKDNSPGSVTSDFLTALNYLIKQMKNNATIAKCTCTAGAQTAFMPTGYSVKGNPIFVVSLTRPDGIAGEYHFAELLTFRATSDAGSGTGVARQEQISVFGQASAAQFDYSWPIGSGVSTTLNLVDASQNNDGNTVLMNGDFETFTNANIPDNWVKVTGTVGTQIVAGGSSNSYTGSNSLGFVGDGVTLTCVSQAFSTAPSTVLGAGGTAYALTPETVYIVNVWLKNSVAPGYGTLIIELVDGNGTVINDDAGTANQITKTLPTMGTSWTNVNGVFRTPAIPPTTTPYFIRLRLSVPISNGSTLYIDRFAMALGQLLYAGGPFVRGFSGSVNVNATGIAPDSWQIQITNDRAGTFQTRLNQFLGMAATGLQVPSAGSPSISDNLVV